MNAATFGAFAEDVAARFLQHKGYTIIDKNYRVRLGEIDIVARLNNCIVFVEVKARSTIRHGMPREYVTPAKQRRIIATAQQYLVEHDALESDTRFDVIELFGKNIVHIKGAFEV